MNTPKNPNTPNKSNLNMNSPNRLALSLRQTKSPNKPRFSLNLSRVPRIPIEREDDSSISAQRTTSSIRAQLSNSSSRKLSSQRNSSSRGKYILSITSRSDSSGSQSSRGGPSLPPGLISIPWDPTRAVTSINGPPTPPSRESLLTCPPEMSTRVWKKITISRDVDSISYDPMQMPSLPPVDSFGNEYIEYDHWREFVMYFYTHTLSRLSHNFFLSSDVVAASKPVLLSSRITHILNTAGTACLNHFKDDFVYRRWLLNDEPRENIASIFYEVVDFIETTLSQDPHSRFLVHCSQGVSRSTTSCICYLAWKHNQTASFILDRIKRVRRVAEPNAGFNAQVTLWANIRLAVYEAVRLLQKKIDPFTFPNFIDGSLSVEGANYPIYTQTSASSTYSHPIDSPRISTIAPLSNFSGDFHISSLSTKNRVDTPPKAGNERITPFGSYDTSQITSSVRLVRSSSLGGLNSPSFLSDQEPFVSPTTSVETGEDDDVKPENSRDSLQFPSNTKPTPGNTSITSLPDNPLGSAFGLSVSHPHHPRSPPHTMTYSSSPPHSIRSNGSGASGASSSGSLISQDPNVELLSTHYDPSEESRLSKPYLPTALFRVCPRNIRDCEHVAPRPCRPDEFTTIDPRYIYIMQTVARPAPNTFPQHFLFLWIGIEADSRLLAPAKLGCSYLQKYESAPVPTIIHQGEEPFAFWAGLGWDPSAEALQNKDSSFIYPHVPEYIEHTVIGHKIDLKSWEETLQSVQKRRPSRFDRITQMNRLRRSSLGKIVIPPLSPTPEQERLLLSSGLVRPGSFSSSRDSGSARDLLLSSERSSERISSEDDSSARSEQLSFSISIPGSTKVSEINEQFLDDDDDSLNIETDEIVLYDCEAEGFHREVIADPDHLYVESIMLVAVYPLCEIHIWIGKNADINKFSSIYAVEKEGEVEKESSSDSSWERLAQTIASLFWEKHQVEFERQSNISSSDEEDSSDEDTESDEDSDEDEDEGNDSSSSDEDDESLDGSSSSQNTHQQKKLVSLNPNPEAYSLFIEFQGRESKDFLYYMS